VAGGAFGIAGHVAPVTYFVEARKMLPRRALIASSLTITCLAGATPASAEESIVAPNCSAVVDGTPGQLVALDPLSLTDPIAGLLAGVDPLGLLAGPFREAWQGGAPIPVGVVPAGEATIAGTAIADAVVARLGEVPVLGLVIQTLTPAVRASVTTACGILVRARGALPGVPPPSESPPPGQTPGGGAGQAPGQPGGVAGSPAVPYRPSASERYYQGLSSGLYRAPGYGPGLGSLAEFGQRAPGAAPVPQAGSDPGPTRSAGDAEAMLPTRDTVPPAVLLAVFLLAAVGAALVRRLVLRTNR
jgi:hypothetical protein